MINRENWIRHLAITAHYFAHDDCCECLLKEGLISLIDAQDICRYIRAKFLPREIHRPRGPEHIPVGRKAVNREAQLSLPL